MRAMVRGLIVLLAVIASAIGGFVAAHKLDADQWSSLVSAWVLPDEPKASDPARKVLYYRNPMGLPDTSPTPKKDSMGMDYIPVYEDEVQSRPPERRVLYYRNPMGLPDTSPVPKKDSMGMDYIPVYEEGSPEADPSVVTISIDRVQRAGVRTEPVERRGLTTAIHVPGTVQLDERRQWSVTMRAEGFIEEIYAGATGQHVEKGQPLFRIYSPQIVQAQVDYRVAAGQGARQTGARKLRNLGVPEAHIESLNKKGDLPLSLDWPSPERGVLMTKNIVVGQRVMPGDELYRLADVSTVWVMADVPEQEIGRIKVGDRAIISVRAFAGQQFVGQVAFILPELKPETRTAQVRVELPNPGHRLLHQMFAEVVIEAEASEPVLSVPSSAVIDSGLRQVVIVDVGEGRFTPREVKLGRRTSDFAEVLQGLKANERVVTRANFLIDAESNLKAALTALSSGSGSGQ
jgi:membrane fusion protein, copper/silver efflux system